MALQGIKTRRLTTILTSAYLSAMLATSVAPIRSDATLAATIDPMAAQKALQSAVSGLDAAGWLAASQTAPTAVPVNNPTPKADPVMTEELMGRLTKFTRNAAAMGSLSPKLCAILNLCDGTKAMPVVMGKSDATDAEHYLALPLNVESKDIVIVVDTPLVVHLYLTDKTGKLRAAAVSENGSVYLITNENAAEKFKHELSLFAGEAADLPPTGTATAGNS